MIKICDNFSRQQIYFFAILVGNEIKEQLCMDIEIPKEWFEPGKIISADEISAFVSNNSTTQSSNNFEIPEEELLMLINCVDEMEDKAVANSISQMQIHKNNQFDTNDIYDAFTIQCKTNSTVNIPKCQDLIQL